VLNIVFNLDNLFKTRELCLDMSFLDLERLSREEMDEEIGSCREVLEGCLESSDLICLNTKNCRSYIDDVVASHLEKVGKEKWLVNNGSWYQTGGVSELVLIRFVREEKVFDNPHVGKYKIEETYLEHSVRAFTAHGVE
jgi:hypothetical protein